MYTKYAIIGYGWVGQAVHEMFNKSEDVLLYDPYATNFAFSGLTSKEQVNEREVAFICVPTPNSSVKVITGDSKETTINGEGVLDTHIVEEVIKWCECPLIVIRSTVNPGDCDKWSRKYNKNIIFQPEYLGETPNHPLLDQNTRPFLVIGGSPENRRKLIEIYTQVYNANISIRQVTNYEAEVIKLTENRAIAWKVAQCQELYDVCEKDINLDYYTIIQAVYGDDPRFNRWFTFIYPENRGMNSKCIPKDVYAWCAWAESLGYEPKITRALLEKNKEWIHPLIEVDFYSDGLNTGEAKLAAKIDNTRINNYLDGQKNK